MILMILFILLLIVIYAFIDSMIPIVIGAALMLIVIAALFAIFQRRQSDTEKVAKLKNFLKILCTGLVVLIPGIVICIRSSRSYYAFFTHTLVFGGPRPGGIFLVAVGIVIMAIGVLFFRPK